MRQTARISGDETRGFTRPTANLIRDDAEAIAVARALAPRIAEGAVERDRNRILPRAELDLFSGSGLWGITVPRAYGGADVSFATLAEVIAIISEADPSVGQIPQNHLGVVEALRVTGNEEQKRRFYAGVLEGRRFGNAFSEAGSKNAGVFDTKLNADGDGFRVTGQKFYATGALFADIVPIAATGEDGNVYLVFADPRASGLTIIDNWSGFGQRTTASGTVTLDNVWIEARDVIPAHLGYDEPSANGPVSQIIQAAVDLGIARAAIADTIRFVRTQSRPWIDSGQDHAWQDPYTIAAVGDLVIRFARGRGDPGTRRPRRRPRHRRSPRDHRRRGLAEGRGGQGADHRDRDPGGQQAARTGGDPLDARAARARPALAQCAHAYAARSGAVEIRADRQPRAQRRAAAAPRLDLTRCRARSCSTPST